MTARADASQRLICASCGTKVLNEPVATLRCVLPALCETTDWCEPPWHVEWRDHTLELRDDLPKFVDYPAELGGTGQRADASGAARN